MSQEQDRIITNKLKLRPMAYELL